MKWDISISGKSNIYSLLLFSLVTITCLSGLASAATTVSIVPTSESVGEMQEFSVNVYLQPDRPVAGIQFDLLYDNNLVNVVTVSEGDLLGQEGALVWFNPGIIESSSGEINSVYGVILDKTSITGSGSAAVIQMRAGNVSGTTNLSLSNVVVSDSQGQIVPTDIVDGSITISSGSSSSSGGSNDKNDYRTAVISAISGSYEEFDVIEKEGQSVSLNSEISYQFNEPSNPIMYINYESLTNAGNVIATIEVLKQQSLLVSSAPPGTVYKNVNIWLGKPGYATESNMKDAVIGFRVDKSWLEDNRISDRSVMMYRYDQDTWVPLPTTKISETSSDVKFETKTTAFSPFVIVGDIPEDVVVEVIEANEPSAESESLDQNAALILCLSILILLFARKR